MVIDDTLAAAWQVRQANWPARITFAAPGAKRYDTAYYRNRPASFVDVSITGRGCALNCEHCRRKLLDSMTPALTPQDLTQLGRKLKAAGALGLLVSGGADPAGQVPLAPFLPAIAELVQMGLRVIVHTGLVERSMAAGLKHAGVEQVLLDIIGDAETARSIYHLERTPADYAASLANVRAAGLAAAPHIVIGLHRGEIRGEREALRIVAAAGVERVVLVILSPLPGTPLAEVPPPALDEVGTLLAEARLLLPRTPIALGCARPAGAYKLAAERLAVDAGLNAIAYPAEATVEHAKGRGLAVEFTDLCCSLA